MKNPTVLDDDIAYLFIHHKGQLLATAIDFVDVPLLSGMNVKWSISETNGRPFVRANVPASDTALGHRTVYLHRLLTRASRGAKVCHLNGNTLENCRRNLACAAPPAVEDMAA
ncbi:MAG: hypothetical protein P4L56_15575 [Candidatus Sulfopaludibacter sp.]|nr:hypothetical protein [Candidatus Sulfopaludibacter sp.]